MSGRREGLGNKEKRGEGEGDAEREMKEEADGQGKRPADRDIEKRGANREECRKSARLLQIYDRT